MLELLVAVGLLGVAGVGVLALFSSSIRSSAATERIASKQAWLSSAADLLVGPNVAYVPCDADPQAAYQALLDAAQPTLGWPADTLRVASVELWDDLTGTWSSTCADAHDQLHRITLRIDDSTGTRRLEVVKVGDLS